MLLSTVLVTGDIEHLAKGHFSYVLTNHSLQRSGSSWHCYCKVANQPKWSS